MPKVSIIIPVYGVEKYIERCARSLFEQTLVDIEYLFIDDCTTDRSIDILYKVLEEYPLRKSQVIIHRMEKNSGQALVRKWGMQNATGDFIIHCDTDDWIDKDIYFKLYSNAIEKDADMVACDYYITDGQYHQKADCFIPDDKDYVKNFILRRNKCCLWNKLIKRELCQNKKITYPVNNMGEDLAIVLQVVTLCNNISYINEPLYFYFQNKKSISNLPSTDSTLSRWNHYMSNVKLVESYYKENGIYDRYKNEFVSLKYSAKKHIEPIIKQKNYYDLWQNTFPEINNKIIFCKYIKVKDKVNYVFKNLNLFIRYLSLRNICC